MSTPPARGFPSLFVSHGAPTFALEPGRAGALLKELSAGLPRPEAVLVLSPHWCTQQIRVTTAEQPETIHDFRGFPPDLYRLQYPAPGQAELASRVIEQLERAGFPARPDATRGLDHGVWVPLFHIYPAADIPVVQVSMPETLDAHSAFELGQALAPFAQEGVLIIGSGSLTHNLGDLGRGEQIAPYAQEFVAWVRAAVKAGDPQGLIHALEQAPNATRAHPTSEHFLPLLIAAGAAPSLLPVDVLEGGFVLEALSMESYVFGRAA